MFTEGHIYFLIDNLSRTENFLLHEYSSNWKITLWNISKHIANQDDGGEIFEFRPIFPVFYKQKYCSILFFRKLHIQFVQWLKKY